MTPEKALAALAMAATQGQILTPSQVHQLRAIVTKALTEPVVDTNTIRSLQAERTDMVLRIAELEEELAAAKKPKRRTRRKKTDDTST